MLASPFHMDIQLSLPTVFCVPIATSYNHLTFKALLQTSCTYINRKCTLDTSPLAYYKPGKNSVF